MQARAKKRRVLISAYACSPVQGSEPGVGWGFVVGLAEKHELDVIVEEEKYRTEIEHWQTANPNHAAAGIQFHFIAKKRNRFLRKIWPPSYYWYYRQWHRDAAQLAAKLDRHRDFDLLHQLTMVGFREPGYLWSLGKPFVWGPFGGAGLFPWRFLGRLGMYAGLYYLFYNVINALQLRLLRRPRDAARLAGTGLIAATRENQEAARIHWGAGATVLSEVGLNGEGLGSVRTRRFDEPLKIVWNGQHIPRKALDLALDAVARLSPDVSWELHILGTGPRTKAWKRRAKKLGIAGQCRFHGWKSRDEALAITRRAHVALISSLRDLTSTVTVEALEAGLPTIALDHCGFRDALDETCGLLVPVTSPDQVVGDIATALTLLAENEEQRRRLASGALDRAQVFSLPAKAIRISEIYEERLRQAESESSRL